MFILSAAAAVGVEDKRRFNFGCADMQLYFGQKQLRLQRKIIEIDTLEKIMVLDRFCEWCKVVWRKQI